MNGLFSPLQLSQRCMPANLEAEAALLGGLLANNKALARCEEFLRPEHFAEPLNGLIYEAICGRVRDGRVADAISLKAQFEHAPEFEAVGGVGYLAGLLASMVGITVVGDYARVVRDQWVLRELISACGEAVERSFVPDESGSSPILEELETQLLRIAAGAGDADPTTSIGDAVGQAVTAAEAASKRPDGLAGLSWGYAALDRMTTGLITANFYVLGARPAMGKTALGLAIAIRNAAAGNRTLYWSGEMIAPQLGARAAAAHAGVSTQSVFTGRKYPIPDECQGVPPVLAQHEWDRLVRSEQAARLLPLELDTRPAITVAQLRARARRMKRSKAGLSLVVVDYLGLMRGTEAARRAGRYAETSEISADLNALSTELDVPVIALAQLNRANESREDKRPTLADLRDSGAIEQDAAFVAFIHREHYYLNKMGGQPVKRDRETQEQYLDRCDEFARALAESDGAAEILISKNRHGPEGKVRLSFHNETTWFRDLSEHERSQAWVMREAQAQAPL